MKNRLTMPVLVNKCAKACVVALMASVPALFASGFFCSLEGPHLFPNPDIFWEIVVGISQSCTREASNLAIWTIVATLVCL